MTGSFYEDDQAAAWPTCREGIAESDAHALRARAARFRRARAGIGAAGRDGPGGVIARRRERQRQMLYLRAARGQRIASAALTVRGPARARRLRSPCAGEVPTQERTLIDVGVSPPICTTVYGLIAG